MGNDANTVGKELKGAAIGAGYGAAIGSVVPGVGTVVGAGVGAVVGGLTGLLGGGPDAQNAQADLGGRSIDARAIWDQVSPGSSASLHGGAGAAQTLQGVHEARSKQIDSINKTMDAAWQGDSASAAQAGAHPLGTWLDDSAGNLQKSHTFLSTQADCFDTVHKSVQEIAKDPPSAGFLDGINPLSDKDDQINKYNEQGKTNVQAFTNYYNASTKNAGGLPQYQAWQGNNLSNPPGGGGKFPGGPGSGGGGGSFGGGAGGGGGSFSPPNVGNTPPKFDTKVPTGNLPNGPGHIGDPTSNLPGGYTPGSDTTSASSYVPPSLDPNSFGPGGNPSFGPGGGGGGFGPGGGGAGSGSGIGGVAGFGPGGFGGGGAMTGAGGGAGVGEGGAGGGIRGGAAGGTAGRAGSSGMGGMGGAGKGGKGPGDEDHETKYLVEEDPNELFGSDELTVPPVIGE